MADNQLNTRTDRWPPSRVWHGAQTLAHIAARNTPLARDDTRGRPQQDAAPRWGLVRAFGMG